ncbi:lipoate--protein ligase family protein [Butyricicoccus sp.]|uniref:lipoate--protein ligase family protein n=1 Tax=Butyricicoccus sp. TaxID=2049021 RepID=UPI003F169C78
MKQNLTVVITNETNPYHNIALEECILYLWQNRNTVVIGRNQHAENECRVQELQKDGGFLARRLSGGGAVYHDLGNLNFTFLAYENHFDISSQNEVILRAVKRLGVQAEKNGRNDLTVDGKKFSGHAYYKTGGRCYHHGTLMVDVDYTKLAAYLEEEAVLTVQNWWQQVSDMLVIHGN